MRILLAMTGASGLLYGTRTLDALRSMKGHEVSAVISSGAKKVAAADGTRLPEADFGEFDFDCPYASGSNPADALIIAPCSLKTLGEIANGVGNSLITRAAEVSLKERKKLVLVVRDTPLSLIAIENMRRVTLAGGIILPACPGFYGKPKRVEDMVDFVVARVLDQLGVKNRLVKRWKE
jgi:4-hydroxy-3-polyprenylbenzoate decarboxylase